MRTSTTPALPTAAAQVPGAAAQFCERPHGARELEGGDEIRVRESLEGFSGAGALRITERGDFRAGVAVSGQPHQRKVGA